MLKIPKIMEDDINCRVDNITNLLCHQEEQKTDICWGQQITFENVSNF